MENEYPHPTNTNSCGNDNEQLLAVVTHLIPIVGFVFPALGTILGPIIWWAIMKDKSQAVHDHGIEVINLSISYSLYILLCLPLVLILIGIPMIAMLTLGLIVLVIIGAIKAGSGEFFRYPLILRLLK